MTKKPTSFRSSGGGRTIGRKSRALNTTSFMTGRASGSSGVTSRNTARKAPQRSADQIVAQHPPVHPGTILRDEFMAGYALTAYGVAKALHIPRSRIERIVRGELGISGDTAVRLGRLFNTSAQFWMNLQATYEVMKARQAIGAAIEDIEPLQQPSDA
jgi:addiction module HigA family antidote